MKYCQNSKQGRPKVWVCCVYLFCVRHFRTSAITYSNTLDSSQSSFGSGIIGASASVSVSVYRRPVADPEGGQGFA